MKTDADEGYELLAQRVVFRQHEVNPGGQDAVNFRNRARKLLAQRENHLRALLHGRGDETILLEDLPHVLELLLGETSLLEDGDRVGEAPLVDHDRVLTALDRHALRRDPALLQGRDHLVGLALIKIVVELRFAGREQQGDKQYQGPLYPAWQ